MRADATVTCGPVFYWTPSMSTRYISRHAEANMRDGRSKPARTTSWFTVRSVPMRITIVDPGAKTTIREKKVISWCSIIRRIACCVDKLSGTDPMRPACMDVTVYLWDGKKTLDRSDAVIGPENANTGVSIIDKVSGNTKILVYRKEEAIKTLVHEILHAYQVGDWANEDDCVHARCRDLAEINGIGGLAGIRFTPTEAIVESLAVRITSNLFGGSSWKSCVSHARKLACDLVSRCTASGSVWRQRTNAFEYYIVKTVILTRMDDLLTAHVAGLQKPDKALIRDIIRDDGSFVSRRQDAGVRDRLSLRMTPLALAPCPQDCRLAIARVLPIL